MHSLMQHCLLLYLRATKWNDENQYSNLCSASRSLLDFTPPTSLTFNIAKSPTPLFKTAYSLQTLPALTGSIGYLYASKPIDVLTSRTVPMSDMVDSVKVITSEYDELYKKEKELAGKRRDHLLYGHLNLPKGQLEALYARRISENWQTLVTTVSNPGSIGSSLTTQLQYDSGRWCSELSFTTEDRLIGLRSLYNFQPSYTCLNELEGRWKRCWSAGGEIYYTAKERSGGISTGIRYRSSSPEEPQVAYTDITYTFNPMMGHMSACYITTINEDVSACSRFDYNMYSYESDLAIGVEWRIPGKTARTISPTCKGNDLNANSSPLTTPETEHEGTMSVPADNGGVLKGRLSIQQGLALVLEGRFRGALYSIGLMADLSKRMPLSSVGLEIQYFA